MMKNRYMNYSPSRRGLLLGTGAAATGAALGFGGNLVARQFDVDSYRAWKEYEQYEASPEAAAEAMSKRGLVTRKSISTLPLDSDEYMMFKEAVGVMRARSERDILHPGGWISHATNHGLYCSSAVSGLQVHWSWYFLPWHRAFLYYLERALASAIAEPNFALPYWDVSSNLELPAQYWGDDSPMSDTSRGIDQGDKVPAEVLDMNACLKPVDFQTFGGFAYTSDDQEFTDGVLETHMHNCVHNWVGGNLGNSFLTSGFDPAFSGHHGNIDRMWASWSAMEGREHPDDEGWLNTAFQFDNWEGKLEQITIRELLNTEELGYKFDTLDVVQPEIATPELRGEAVGHAVTVDHSQGTAIANNIDTGRRYVKLEVNRSTWPFSLNPSRVFLGVEGETPDYVTSIAPLPNILGGAKRPNAHVNTQVAVSQELAEAIDAGKKIVCYVEYIQYKSQRPVPVDGVFELEDINFTLRA